MESSFYHGIKNQKGNYDFWLCCYCMFTFHKSDFCSQNFAIAEKCQDLLDVLIINNIVRYVYCNGLLL